MVSKLLSKIFGSRNDRLIKRMRRQIERINALEPQMEALSDEQLKTKTGEFRSRLAAGETLDSLLNEAFAVVREASRRVLGMRHFDVQLIGGIVLNDGKIAEMRTGEGKTLVATLPVYLNALTGKGVHVITVNDYLAQRDAEWMGRLYAFLGLSTGVILSNQDNQTKREAYACDISYGTNNEFGFDYLRDNMAFAIQDKVQRGHYYAVVDEVDSILIDEARTPLIISGAAEDSSGLYLRVNEVAPRLIKQADEEGSGDYSVDEKQRQIYLTEEGHQHVEEMLLEAGMLNEGESLYDPGNVMLLHHIHAALRAHVLYQKNVHYIIRNGEVVIVDEFTGRTMPGRRWSDGLHQAVEAKEGLPVKPENHTLASITFQNYFRIYEKLSGMTGTADTEAFEFQQIYGLEVMVIPTNRPIQRKDFGDQVFLTEPEKFAAVVEDIKQASTKGQPVLVGTASIESSEYLSNLLNEHKIKHDVLNAKQHEREADIIAQAGRPSAVTIATNMAGRGTDIMLGGNLEKELAALGEAASDEQKAAVQADWEQRHQQVLDAGGLHVVGTERHESRRVDNQLRGRSGRQGDVGSTRFYVSLQDNLMRIFASDRIASMMQRLGMQEGESIEHPWVSKAIENAQRKVEGHNFDTRKQLLEYDDVANDQRKVIYAQRDEMMAATDISDTIRALLDGVTQELIDKYIPPDSMEEQWNVEGLQLALAEEYGQVMPLAEWLEQDSSLHEETLRERILENIRHDYQAKSEQAGVEVIRHFEKAVMLQTLDAQWKDHLAAMDYLRQGIHLRGYAQKNPKQEYKREAFEMFNQLLNNIRRDVVRVLLRVQIQAEEDVQAIEEQRRQTGNVVYQHEDLAALHAGTDLPGEAEHTPVTTPFVRESDKVGRNDPCPCGSGKKYKHCHGALS